MQRWLAMLVAITGCGRISFDAIPTVDDAAAVDGLPALPPAGLYYADDGIVFRIDFATGTTTTVISTLGYPNGMAFDPLRRTLYIADDQNDQVLACDAPAFVPRVVATPSERIEGLAIDGAGTTIYYAAKDVNEVWALGVDGQSPRRVLSGVTEVDGVVFDPTSDRIYMTSASATGFIARARADGSDYEVIVPSLDSPEGIALDGEGHIYFVDESAVRRADVDGGNVQMLVPGVMGGEGLSLDLVNGHIYWSDSGSLEVWRANLDGTGAASLESGLVAPEDVTVGP